MNTDISKILLKESKNDAKIVYTYIIWGFNCTGPLTCKFFSINMQYSTTWMVESADPEPQAQRADYKAIHRYSPMLDVKCHVVPKCVLSHSVMSDSVTPGTVACQALSIGFPRQEYGVGCHFLFPGDLPNPETEPTISVSPTLAGGCFIT